MDKNRNFVIDIIKALAIYLVVYGHLQSGMRTETSILIATCHMPVFFGLSGLFFEKSLSKYGAKGFLINKCKTLLLPYLIWSAVSFFINVANLILRGNLSLVGQEFKDIFLYARSVWFLIILFWTNIVTMLLRKIAKSQLMFQIVAWVGWFICLFADNIEVFEFFKFRWLYPYFLLGMLVASRDVMNVFLGCLKKSSLFWLVFKWIVVIMAYCFAVLVVYNEQPYNEYYGKFQLNYSHWGYYLIYYMLGVLGIVVIMFLAELISRAKLLCKVFSEIGQNSLGIYVIHMFFVNIILGVVNTNKNQVMMAVFAIVIVALIYIMIKYVFNRSKIYQISVGGRYDHNNS